MKAPRTGSAAAQTVQKMLEPRASYYQIMKLSNDASGDQVKKAFKQLSLQVHPDRNHARRAEEAFKVLHQAFTVLADPTALRWGAGCLAAQCALTCAYKYLLPRGPWTATPAFTAHQSITLPLYSYVAYIGTVEWCTASAASTATLASRCLEVQPVGSFLVRLTGGVLLLWDLPTILAVPRMRDTAVIVHHALVACLAVLGLRPLFQWSPASSCRAMLDNECSWLANE